jgi:hypothetical protein
VKAIVRWLVAGLVTIAAFAVVTWISGVLALPHLIEDPVVRWGIAGALGVAVAALAALWGHSFAVGEQAAGTRSRSQPLASKPTTGRGSTRNRIRRSTFYGPVVQARDVDVSGPISSGPAPPASPSSDDE